ncbi:MAG TPA: DHA2 family efflux MFS transporter permease subunit [Steroidobacteraceae bacterium]
MSDERVLAPPSGPPEGVAPDVVDASTMSERQKTIAFLIMALGMFIALLDIQIVASSLAEIQAGLAATPDEVAEVQTWYLVAEVIMIPLSGWLSRILSTRWLFTASAAGFTLASAGCAFAWNIESMIAFRTLQGFLGGAMVPTAFATGFAIFPGEKQGRVAPILGIVATCAPALGPTIGGYITEILDWRWLFFINFAPGLFIVLTIPRLLRIDRPNPYLLKHFDVPGAVFLASCLGCLQYVLDEGPRKGWFEDHSMLTLFVISIASGALFIWRSLTYREPIVDLRAFRVRNFSLGCVLSLVTGVGLYGMVYLTALFFVSIRGWDSMQVGRTVFVFGLSQLFATPIAGILSRKLDPRYVLTFGFSLYAFSTWMLCSVTARSGFDEVLLSQILRGIASMTCIVTVTNVALGSMGPVQLKSASGLFNLMRNLGGAIGLAVLNTQLFYNRFELHYDRLVSAIDPSRLDSAAAFGLAERLADQGLDADVSVRQATTLLAKLVAREALVQSFADAFLLVAACFLVGLLLVPWLRSIRATVRG